MSCIKASLTNRILEDPQYVFKALTMYWHLENERGERKGRMGFVDPFFTSFFMPNKLRRPCLPSLFLI